VEKHIISHGFSFLSLLFLHFKLKFLEVSGGNSCPGPWRSDVVGFLELHLNWKLRCETFDFSLTNLDRRG
jgi:hypothetical protein